MSIHGAQSTVLTNTLLNFTLRGVSYTPPSNVYIALYTNNPTDADIGTEIDVLATSASYQRVKMSCSPSVWGVNSTTGSITNLTEIKFNGTTGSWGSAGYVGIRTGSQSGTDLSSGSLLFYGPLTGSPIAIGVGETFKIAAGSLNFSLGNGYTYYMARTLLTYLFNGTAPITWNGSLALYITSPTRSGSTSGVEVSASDYSRATISGSSYWNTPTAGSTSNASTITFTTSAGENWGLIKAIGIFQVTGELMMYGNLDTSISVLEADGVIFNPGTIKVYGDSLASSSFL